MKPRLLVAIALLVLTASAALGAGTAEPSPSGSPAELFRRAGEAVRAGDLPKALELYRSIADSGHESPSLYWNWAQAAQARGAAGESLWALLRARDIDPADRAVGREIERLREALNLEPAEIAPEPLEALGRTGRRFRLDLVAALLLLFSLVFHVVARLSRASRWPVAAGWALALVGLAVAAVPVAASRARPTAVVVRRGAPLADAASPTAEVTGTLREGEVVPVLARSGNWLRVEDSSGARGWAVADDVRRVAGR